MTKQNLTSTQEQLLTAISVPAENAEVQAVRDFLKENLHDVTVADSKRGTGCPVQDSIASCYRELSGLELRVAFNFGLVGNNNRRGRIIANVMQQFHGNEVEEVASVSTRTDSRRWWKMYENKQYGQNMAYTINSASAVFVKDGEVEFEWGLGKARFVLKQYSSQWGLRTYFLGTEAEVIELLKKGEFPKNDRLPDFDLFMS